MQGRKNMTIPKRMSVLIILLFVGFFGYSQVLADEVTLAWDANSSSPDGYRLFMRTNDNLYDYNLPVLFTPYPDGDIASGETSVTVQGLSGIPYELVNYSFVLRAFMSTDESGDSNEVLYSVDRTAPGAAMDLSGDYDKTEQKITLNFNQPDYDKVAYWKVFYTESSGGPYVEFETAENTGLADNTVTSPFTYVLSGENKDIYFVIVSYRNSEVWSNNSNEILVNIDRRILMPPENLRLVVEVPVQ